MVSRTKDTLARERAKFLAELAKTCNVVRSAEAANLNRKALYTLRNTDPEFRKLWDEALDLGADMLEAEAVRRAHEGYLEPVFQGGKQVGEVRRYSDSLMGLLLRAHKPEKYRERTEVKHSVTDALAATLESARKRLSNGDDNSNS